MLVQVMDLYSLCLCPVLGFLLLIDRGHSTSKSVSQPASQGEVCKQFTRMNNVHEFSMHHFPHFNCTNIQTKVLITLDARFFFVLVQLENLHSIIFTIVKSRTKPIQVHLILVCTTVGWTVDTQSTFYLPITAFELPL